MKKYLFLNKKVILGYSIMAIITYYFLTLMYRCYSLITVAIEESGNHNPVNIALICIGILLLLLILLDIMSVIKRKILFNVNHQFRKDIFSKTFRMGYSKYSQKGKEYYTSILLNDIETLQDDYFANVIEFIGDLFQLIIMLVSISMVGVRYMILVVLFSIPSCVHPFILKNKIEENARVVSKYKEKYTKKSESILHSFFIFKSFRKEEKLSNLFRESVVEMEQKKFVENNWRVLNSCLMALFIYILKVGSQLFFTYSAIDGVITVATVTMLLGLANNVGNPIASILQYIGAINSTKSIREKCIDLLNSEDLSGKDGKITDYDIRLDNITYRYTDSKIVINQMNYTFEKGKKYVLLGPSGCGKSTLFKILLGYVEAEQGKVFIGNENIRDIDFHELHKNIACISQTPFVFSGTIRDNITMYNDRFSDEEIWDALEQAGVKKVVESKAGGLDEMIEVGGNNFSGGEKQRLSIARAILLDSPILLIDEGMSALDNETADIVERNILNCKDKTVIAISHRIQQSLELYDAILILKCGKIVSSGDFEHLNQEGGILKEFIEDKEYDNEAV